MKQEELVKQIHEQMTQDIEDKYFYRDWAVAFKYELLRIFDDISLGKEHILGLMDKYNKEDAKRQKMKYVDNETNNN